MTNTADFDFDLSSMTMADIVKDDASQDNGGVDTAVDQQVADQPAQTGQQPQQQQQPAPQDKTPAPQQQTQPQQQQPQQQPGRPGTDEHGNLVGPDGTVIAKAGAERRHFERARDMERHSRNVEAQLAEARNELAQTRAQFQQFQSSGLTPEQATHGIQWVAQFHKDPLGTVKTLLTQLEAQGINVRQQLFPDSGAANMAAIQQMLDQRLAPLQQDRERQVALERQQIQARHAYDAFIARHEFAGVHEDQIAAVMHQFGLDAPTAYWRLNAWAAQKGLDFSRPLGPQLNTAQQQQQAAPRSTTPLRGGGNAPVQPVQKAIGANAGWDEIISAAMNE